MSNMYKEGIDRKKVDDALLLHIEILRMLAQRFPDLEKDYYYINMTLQMVLANKLKDYMVNLDITKGQVKSLLKEYEHNVEVLMDVDSCTFTDKDN